MNAVTPRLLLAGVVPAVCDAEAGQELASDVEPVIEPSLEHSSDISGTPTPPREGAH